MLPILLRLKELPLRSKYGPEEESGRANYGVLSIAAITVSNGADNLAVYIPFFVTGRNHLWLILSTYGVLIAIWCFVGRWFGSHPILLRSVQQWGHWIVPFVLISLGIYILAS